MRICLALAAIVTAVLGNQLTNPDFGLWDNPSRPSGWRVEDSTKARIERSADPTYSPPYACRMTRLVAGTGSNYGLSQVLPVAPGRAYTIAAWFLDTDPNCRAGISITWCRADTTSLGNSGVNYTDSTSTGWQSVVKCDTAPDSTVYAKCLFRVYGFAGRPAGGIVYIDEAYFDEGLNPMAEAPSTVARREMVVRPSLTALGASIKVTTPAATSGVITIRDLAGQTRSTLHSGPLRAGERTFVWNGRDHTGVAVSDGVYFIVLEHAGDRPLVAKLVVQH